MIMSVTNSPSFGAKLPVKKASRYISKTEFQQNKIEQLKAEIGIVNRDTDSLYKSGYDDSGRLTPDARASIAKNESKIDSLKSYIDLLRTDIARRSGK